MCGSARGEAAGPGHLDAAACEVFSRVRGFKFKFRLSGQCEADAAVAHQLRTAGRRRQSGPCATPLALLLSLGSGSFTGSNNDVGLRQTEYVE